MKSRPPQSLDLPLDQGFPPYAETQAYVARVLALAGQGAALHGGGADVVLMRAGNLLA